MDDQLNPGQPAPPSSAAPADAKAAPYRVLARKYRPTTFSELIGQEAMVRTLTNAMKTGRLAHAFILTGVRGIGKTTTARLIARALNCIGRDGTGGPTIDPCGECVHCKAIAEDRHMDVMEMDAASRTGVDDIREVIDSVQYRPTSARAKIYIIDEVHMLSKNAFNALLKTLEEPPAHVKFIFATTEVRKVPVTVLSRCQRFDLRRVDAKTLAAHFAGIAEKENVSVAPGALQLIARAADGSVRDGLSLLDQAIAHCAGAVGEDEVRTMIGLVDRTRTFDLLEAAMRGDARAGLDILADLYAGGADPAVIVEDMLELVHWLTRVKLVPEAADDPGMPEAERVRGRAMAEALSMAVLTRAWQMLLKGLAEVRHAPSPLQAAEMVLVRLVFAADLPSPAEAVASLGGSGAAPARTGGSPSGGGGGAPAATASQAVPSMPSTSDRPRAAAIGGQASAGLDPLPQGAVQPDPQKSDPATFADVVALTLADREMILHANLISNLHLVRFEQGRIEFRPGEHAPGEMAHDLSRFLNARTTRRWVVTVSREAGQPTLRQQDEKAEASRRSEAAQHPLVQAVMETFPGAEIEAVRNVGGTPARGAFEAALDAPAEPDADEAD
ncbi:MAG: DNA polymerase III subunit gamma/tau [Rhodospirillales bacterium]|nr:DNA polymerase III subunit gamma/tau [Rhodospirillales bacterium]